MLHRYICPERIDAAAFAQKATELSKELEASDTAVERLLIEFQPNVSVDELQYADPHETIERSISREIERVTQGAGGEAAGSASKRKRKGSSHLRNHSKSLDEIRPKIDYENIPKYEYLINEPLQLKSSIVGYAQKLRESRLRLLSEYTYAKASELAQEGDAISRGQLRRRPTHTEDTNRIRREHVGGSDVSPLSTEVVYEIYIYHPETGALSQVINALGTQTLSEIRELIVCPVEQIEGVEPLPSCLFFIDGTFYTDNAVDDAKELCQLLNDADAFVRNFDGLEPKVSSMHSTSLASLELKGGRQCLFYHEGACEHLVVFERMRMWNVAKDLPDRDRYPFHKFLSTEGCRTCSVCGTEAVFVLFNDKYSEVDPFFNCEDCFRQLHYSADGYLLYDDFVVFQIPR